MATGGFITRNHAMKVYDTLYGIDSNFNAHPQMAAGNLVENDGRQWTITLRRWGAWDSYGQALMAATDATLRFRLKRPFPVDTALAKLGGFPAFVMPERLIPADATRPVTEIVGSGPYRYLAAERVQGARNVYARFDAYVPRDSGTAA